MIHSYAISGEFLESCDCFDLCPCWVAEDPDEDHCTGLVAWGLDDKSRINGTSVAGARVAAVTSHNGQRRSTGAVTVLFVDGGSLEDGCTALLATAFSGLTDGTPVPGPLGALARVTGTVLHVRPAKIVVDGDEKAWTLDIRPTDDPASGSVVHVEGRPLAFPDPPDASDRDGDGNPAPPALGPDLTLNGTALHAELRIEGDATAQHTTRLNILVPALPGGYLTVKGRSGMRGEFCYEHQAPAKAQA
jgi:hypothetical protein